MALNMVGRCPRCNGRLLAQQDQYGRYRSCLTCGFVDECWQGPGLMVTEAASGQLYYRQPVHEHRPL
jgi:hypothetical protein